MRGNIVIYHNPSMWFERTPEVMRETPTRVLGFWIQAMAGDRLTPVLSLILSKPKGGETA